MTELQPTEIEFRKKGRKEGKSSLGRIMAILAAVIVLAIAGALTVLLAHRASTDPVILEPATLPAEEPGAQ